jgi:hypothetical protein
MPNKLRFKPPLKETGKRLRPHESSDIPAQTQPPHFSLEHLSNDKHFTLDTCTKDQKAAFADKLRQLSKLTWAQIMNAGRHGQGLEKISRDSIKSPVPSLYRAEHFLAFRFFGKAPMVGYREGRTFFIIWLDPNFKLYNHG